MKTLLLILFFQFSFMTLAQAKNKVLLSKNQVKEFDRRIAQISNVCKHMDSKVIVSGLEEHDSAYCKSVSCAMNDDKLTGAQATQEVCVDKFASNNM